MTAVALVALGLALEVVVAVALVAEVVGRELYEAHAPSRALVPS